MRAAAEGMQGTRQPRWRGMEQQQYGAHVHTREEEREDETGRQAGRREDQVDCSKR